LRSGLIDRVSASAQGPIVYGYSNARVKAMKTHLLTKSQFEEMVRVGNLPGVIEILERTHFKQDIVALSLRHSGAELIGLALGKNMAITYRKLIRIAPNSGKETVMAFLRRWDVHNIKTMLLGKSMGHPPEKIEPLLVAAGKLDERDLKRLMGLDLEGLIGYVRKSEFGPQKEFWGTFKTGDIAPLLAELDREYYRGLGSKVRGVGRDGKTVLSLIKEEIDAKNIMLCMRAKKEGIANEMLEKFLVDGGHVGRRELLRLIEMKSQEEVVRKLARHYDLSEALEKYKKDSSLVHFEIALESEVARKGVKALRRSMLSIGALVGYIYLKEAEVGNVRKIINAIEYGISEEKLKEMLIVAG